MGFESLDILHLDYEQFWGEKKDLRPPSKVEIKYQGSPENLPFSVTLDEQAVGDFMKLEGTERGRDITYILDYGEGLLPKPPSGWLLTKEPPISDWKEPLRELGRDLKQFLPGIAALASASISGNSASVHIDLEIAYLMSLLRSPVSKEQVQSNFANEVVGLLGHETQHCRQAPSELAGISKKDLLKIRYGSLIIIEGFRRLALPPPSLGQDIATLPYFLFLENLLSDVITVKIHDFHPAEREADEIANQSQETWKKMVGVKLVDKDKLNGMYFWDKIRHLNFQEIKDLFVGPPKESYVIIGSPINVKRPK